MKKDIKSQRIYIWLLLVGIILTACMGESEYKLTYERLGVIQVSSVTSLYTVDGLTVTSPAFAGMKDGDCYFVDFRSVPLDSGNRQPVEVEVLRMDTVAMWPMAATFADTSTVLKNEQLFKSVSISKKNNYAKGRLFVYTTRNYYFDDENTQYNLSYNWDETKERDSLGFYTYDLYLRLTAQSAKDTIFGNQYTVTNAFILDEFLQKAAQTEEEAGKRLVRLRMNYVKALKTDTTAGTWSATDIIDLPLSELQFSSQ